MASSLLLAGEMYFMKLTQHIKIFLAIGILALGMSSCQKGVSNSGDDSKARFQVYLTDDPANYEEVVIDVQDIRINYSSDSVNGWQSLANVNTGTYDVLKLVNDNDTILADAELNPGRIQQIRLILAWPVLAWLWRRSREHHLSKEGKS